MPKITKTLVEALKPSKDGAKSSSQFVWDNELRGFGVTVGQQGTRSFVVQYRSPNGQSRRKVIGRSRKAIKPSTLAMDRSRIESHIRPLLGHRIIETLKLGDIEAAQAHIAAGATSKPRVGSRGGATKGGDGVADRTMSTLDSILEHAVRLAEIEKNPARGIRRIASALRMRWLSQAEIRKLGAALREAEADLEHPKGIAVIRLLLLTGFRCLEALGLERKWLLEEEKAIHFATTKTGAQRRVIGAATVDLLLAQPETGSKYFFPADWGDGHFIGVVSTSIGRSLTLLINSAHREAIDSDSFPVHQILNVGTCARQQAAPHALSA